MTFGARTQEKIDEIVDALGKHGRSCIVLLSGVAGTGKTYLALAAAQKHAGHPLLVKQIQFHQSYSYEDFIEGLHPTRDGGFAPRDGVFLEWNDAALRDPSNNYVLLIEELSRANIGAVLGELMTYLEYRDRLFETPVTRRRLRVAGNISILATMNPRDRSALELDDALLRRVRIMNCPPSVELLGEMLGGSLEPGLIKGIARVFEECRSRHADTYEYEMPFGHGMFAGVESEDDLHRLWAERIKYILHRPVTPQHQYCSDIEEVYTWTERAPAGGGDDTDDAGDA